MCRKVKMTWGRRPAVLASSTVVVITILTACSGDSPAPVASPAPLGSPAPTYSVGGTVSGLAANTTLVLRNNGGNNLTVSTNGAFTFSTPMAVGANYAVTVFTQPAGQTCAVGNGNGTAVADVTSVALTCVATTVMAAWPVLQGIAVGSAPILTAKSRPGYRIWSEDSRTTLPYFPSGSVATEVARISDGAGFGLPGETYFKNPYPKIPAWNADSSLMLVLRAGGAPSYTRAVLIDGVTFEWKRNLTYAGSNGLWSHVERTKYFIQDDTLAQLMVSDVLLDDIHVVRDFAGLGYTKSGGTSIFGGEGRQSNDDRYWPLQLGKANGQWDIVIYDKQTNTVSGVIPLPGLSNGNNFLNTWGMSQAGKFVVTQSNTDWSTRTGIQIPAGINVWALSGQYLRSFPIANGGGHLDYGFDTDGNEVLVFIRSKYEQNDKIGQTWRLDGSDGFATKDQFKDMVGWNYHISTAHTKRPGWAVVSSYGMDIPKDYNWAPMWNHVFAVRLDGSGRIAPIANVHHTNIPVTVEPYDRSAFASANRDLTAVVWSGTWGDADVTRPIHTYVARPKR